MNAEKKSAKLNPDNIYLTILAGEARVLFEWV